MERSANPISSEQKILASLARIERTLVQMERRVKAVQQDLNRGKKDRAGLKRVQPHTLG